MITHSSAEKIATLSNTGEVTDFKIKASSKAFNILSSSLYANKIRAIIRELSTNAYDSHVAAGKKEVPFDVHLPNSFEPWFSIRDYGVGLDEAEVNKIYTTYFESTKTESNDFVGALGLGSKSPFAYTDNFSVTAIKNNKKTVYTAFVNEMGVPAIAKMTECSTDEQSGVEIQFSVENQRDFYKFSDEAKFVYLYFEHKPVVSGNNTFTHSEKQYEEKDIVPGIHTIKYTGAYGKSVAVMGNVAYPIDVPNSEQNLGSLAELLKCNLEIHFNIGDLDFQASREGLSYIPTTIAKIKEKLAILNRNIYKKLAEEISSITNDWKKAIAIREKYSIQIYRSAVTHYVKKHNVKYATYLAYPEKISVDVSEISEKFNVKLSGFSYYTNRISIINSQQKWCQKAQAYVSREFSFPVDETVCFIETDTKTGVFERTKKHWKNKHAWRNAQPELAKTTIVFVISPCDKTKKVDYAGFLKSIGNPPNHILASSIPVEKKKSNGKTVNQLDILCYDGGWQRVGAHDEFSDDKTYYYLELNGHAMSETSKFKIYTPDSVAEMLKKCGVSELNVPLYGVRKHSIAEIAKKENWVNVEVYAEEILKKKARNVFTVLELMQIEESLTKKENYSNESVNSKISDPNSDFLFVAKFLRFMKKHRGYNSRTLNQLFGVFDIKKPSPSKKITALSQKIIHAANKYPLAQHLNLCYNAVKIPFVEYVNMIDQLKKEK